MKKIVLILTLLPLVSSAADTAVDMDLRGLPEDFRRYFYNSEVMVQVHLNDKPLFDAAVSLKENGDVLLLRMLENTGNTDPKTLSLWSGILQQGVSIGKCSEKCPSGLMVVEYRLDNSVLKLYTSQYETSHTQGAFLSMPEETPGGVIMYNDISATRTASFRSWGINSSLTSSLAGWSQKASFQSSGTTGRYHYSNSSLYELFTQKELPGSFLRMGLFTPDNDTGDVQATGFGSSTVAGVMWGTSEALLINTQSASAWPVYVTGRSQSIAEVWRDGRLIYTQQLQAGVQALDTRQLPGGIYDIMIKIIENGQAVDTQQAKIYKQQSWNNADRRWRMNLWGGQHSMLSTGDRRPRADRAFTAGGGLDMLVNPRTVLGMSGAATEKERHLRMRANITLSSNDTLFAQHTFGNTAYQKSQDTDIRYYRNLSGGGSASLFWRTTTTDVYGNRIAGHQRGNSAGTSLSLRLPASSMLMVNSQYIDTAWRKGWGSDVSVTTLATLAGHDINLRVSAFERPGFNSQRRDWGASFGVNISLSPSARHSVSAETGMNQNHNYSSLSYQWQPDDGSAIRTLGGGVSHSPNHTLFSGNASVDTQYASGDLYLQHALQDGTRTAGVNLNQVLLMGGGKVASVNGNGSRSMESAVIVDVDSDDDSATLVASGSMAETPLSAGRNIVPAELWKQNTIQFAAGGSNSIKVFPEIQSVQMNRGSVGYVKVKAVKTYTLVSLLHDERGDVLKNRDVRSDVSDGVINAEGVLTLEVGTSHRTLTVRADRGLPEMQCELPAYSERDKNVRFISTVRCKALKAGVK